MWVWALFPRAVRQKTKRGPPMLGIRGEGAELVEEGFAAKTSIRIPGILDGLFLTATDGRHKVREAMAGSWEAQAADDGKGEGFSWARRLGFFHPPICDAASGPVGAGPRGQGKAGR